MGPGERNDLVHNTEGPHLSLRALKSALVLCYQVATHHDCATSCRIMSECTAVDQIDANHP